MEGTASTKRSYQFSVISFQFSEPASVSRLVILSEAKDLLSTKPGQILRRSAPQNDKRFGDAEGHAELKTEN